MSNKKEVFHKAVELHYKSEFGDRVLSPGAISAALMISLEETITHLDSLSKLRLIKLRDSRDAFEVTRVGLNTTMG